MVGRRGISVADLVLGLPGGTLSVLLPDEVTDALESLAVLEHTSRATTTAYIHEGTTQALGHEPLALPSVWGWKLESPVATTGLGFRVVRNRTAVGTGQNVEPPSVTATVDLHLDPLALTIPRLVPALVAGGTFGSANPAHLVPDPNRDGVRLWGRAILRITLGPSVSVALVDWPDPFNPAAPAGAVAELSFDPPTFLVGTSGFGATIDRVVADLSPTYTPADIIARGQDAAWQGISLREGTLYFPRNAPVVGDLSIGLHDLLVGQPPGDNGLQGEVVVELGRTPVSPAVVEFEDHDGGLRSEINAAGYTLVYLRVATSEIRARLPRAATGLPADPTAEWTLPDGTRREHTATTGWFVARSGESMRAAFTELVGTDRVPGAEVTFVFTLEADVATDPLPVIDVDTGQATIEQVASLSGAPAALADVTFHARPDDGEPTWQLGTGATAQTGTGATFAPRFDVSTGSYHLVLRTGDGMTRRAEVHVLDAGALVAGSAGGPRATDGTDLGVRQLLATYDLATFDRDGRRVANGVDATLEDGRVTVPAGALAAVSAAIGTSADPDEPVPPDDVGNELRHVQVQMLFNQATAAPDQFFRPDGTLVDAPTHVGAWAASFDGAEFLVVGRCCDLGGDEYNDRLAADRATLAASWISAPVFARSEQQAASGDTARVQDAAVAAGLLDAVEAAAQRLITAVEGPISGSDSTTLPRPQYRRADLYAVGGTPTDDTPAAHGELMPQPAHREALLPGEDAPDLPPIRRGGDLPFRTRLTVGWDSPSVHEPADAVPTLAELVLEWATRHLSVPELGDVEPQPGAPGGGATTEVFMLTGRWTHDPQTGQTLFTLSWDSSGDPNGLAHVENAPLAFCLAVGPALLGGIDSGDELGVSLIALAAAGLVAAAMVTDGTVVLNAVEYQIMPAPGGPIQRLVVDYSVAIGIDSAALAGAGIHIRTDPDHPMRVRYRNVGLEFDLSDAKPWYETVRLVYDDVALEIEDPGAWTVDGPLGAVLRVVGTRAGAGSTWIEVDLEFLVDLGVVTISQAIVRLTVGDGGALSVSVRGITVTVDVPGTLHGTGTLALGADGTFRAGIDVTVVPAQLTVGAALAFEPETGFFFLEVRAILPVGIPLGPTGLGLYGFVGRFVTNGTRLVRIDERDLVARELAWYRTPPADKYGPYPGQWALGLGAVVGTALDTGFSFNALGMFVVAFPDPSVIFSIEAKFLATPGAATDDASGAPAAAITGLAVIEPAAVVIAVDGRYSLPDIIDLRVPVSAYFGQPLDTYVRIGADGVANRTGDPVTATLLPGLLDANVWTYLMVEGGRLPNLGGDPRFTFEGFCVGFGAGWSIHWRAGPASLRASAKVLVGLGTKPFMLVGGVFVEGEISLAFASIGASAELVITVQDGRVFLEGKVCATLDLGFFEREACVGIEIGDRVDETAPPPPPPLVKVSFVDRNGFVVRQVDAANPVAAEAVWPDTVPVLEFAHPLAAALPSGSAFQPGPPPAGPEWWGTSKLKYAYRLTGVAIETGGDALAGQLDSTWWWSTSRPGIVAEGDLPLSAEEGRWLALLSWDPRPWARLLAADNTTSPGDPAPTVSRLCEPNLLRPRRGCAFGINAVRTATDRAELRDDTATTTIPSRLAWRVREHLGTLSLADAVALAARRGWALRAGTTVPIPRLATFAASSPAVPDEATGVYEVPTLADQDGPVMTVQVSGDYEPAVVDAQLTLLVVPWGRDPVGDELLCVDFSDPSSVQFTPDGFDFKGLHFVDLHPRGNGLALVESEPPADVRELRFSNHGVRVEFPVPVPAVRVAVGATQTTRPVLANALDVNGDAVDSAACPAGRRRLLTLTSTEPIAAVTLTGGNHEAVLISICVIDPLHPERDDVLDEPPPGNPWPIVLGTPLSGPKVRWEPTVAAEIAIGGHSASIVRYDPPEQGGTWLGSEIWPWLGGRVGVVATCGVNTVAQQLADDQDEYVDRLVGMWNDRVAGSEPARRSLLAADTEFRLRVSWEYQSWLAGEGSGQPPPTDPDGWQAGSDVVWTFRTAAAVPDAELPAAPDPRDESIFDPRAIARYIVGIEPPGGDTTTHFLDDPLLVHFSVDHLEQLLELYDRVLACSLQRTDPPPGAAADYGRVMLTPEYGALAPSRRDPADDRFGAAVAALPCVEMPALGGTTATLGGDFTLEPRARYDLRLVATPRLAPQSSDVLVTVVNFAASRYASPRELLTALGCTDPDPSPVLPHDALLAAAPPRGAASFLAGDTAFDTTLSELGLDPWPLATQPRLVALWRGQAPGWTFEGLLVEADEAIERPGRLAVDTVTVDGTGLDVVRRSTSGARLLLSPPTPLVLGAENSIEIVLTSTVTLSDGLQVTETVTGTRRLLGQPRLAYQELSA